MHEKKELTDHRNILEIPIRSHFVQGEILSFRCYDGKSLFYKVISFSLSSSSGLFLELVTTSEVTCLVSDVFL